MPYSYEWPRPSVAVDLVIFTVRDADLKILLIRRGVEPFAGRWALPGGFVRVSDDPDDQGESLADAAHRELAEETGLPVGSTWLGQLGAYGQPGRDPRGRVISVAWYALVRPDLAPLVHAGSDAAEARWFSVGEELDLATLAFDHAQIVADALARVRSQLDRTTISFELVPPAFTAAELRAVYGAIGGRPPDKGNFQRRFRRLVADGLVERAPGSRPTATRPAAVYRFVR